MTNEKYNLKPIQAKQSKRTNYDKITSSVESLANFMAEQLKYMPCSICPLAKYCGGNCKREIKEWLQKECE